MRKFKTESKRLLDLMINSIYTNKEIFLRELISNGSDALDKLYLTALQAGDSSISRSSLGIEVSLDKEARTLTISDNGIGMNKDALDTNLGVIAHSGSLEFKNDDEVKENDEIDIIGQFGVGFYSSFMVADKVTVVSKAYGEDQAYEWTSDGLEGYNITESEREGCGTTITLQLRENTDDIDYDEYLSSYHIQRLIKRYSDYVRYPIRMEVERTTSVPKPEDAGDDWEPKYETTKEIETINSMVPIWTKRKADVTDEEYNEFYKSQFHEIEDPARVISIHAEGTISYDALLFIPSMPPQDLYSQDFQKGLQLYSSSVLIMDKCADLIPDYFGFVKGIVDTPDLSLNISREMLQQSRELKAIERRIEKKVKSELMDMRDNDREAYEKIFKGFGPSFKFGIYKTYGQNKDLLQDLLLFQSATEDRMITLDEYVASTTEEQSKIYFACGGPVEQLISSPSVRSVVNKGYDVLLGGQTVDEFCLMSIGTYAEKELTNVASGDLDLETEEEKKAASDANETNEDLFKQMADALPEKVTKVEASSMLTEGAAAVAAGGSVSLAMEKYFNTLPDAEDAPKATHVLELNVNHPVMDALKKAKEDGDDAKIESYAKLLYQQALLAEGLTIDNITEFNEAIWNLMV